MQPPATLYHYTSQSGLLGILQSRAIRATKIHFLNDAAEFITAIEVAEGRLQGLGIECTNGGRERIESLQMALAKVGRINVFVVSLTEEGDQLSQWRAYAGSHSGFAIAFDVETLCEFAAQQGFSIAKCVYDERSQLDLVSPLIHAACEDPASHDRAAENFIHAMVEMAPLLKHPSFADEHEWRLVSRPKSMIEPKIGFRLGASTITPYYEIPLISDELGKSCVSGLVVGPTPHPDLAAESLYYLAQKSGLGSVTIERSHVPLRTW